MAVLQTIRTKAAGLLIGTLGLALLAFILSDFFSSGNAFFTKFKDKAFEVDGVTVTTGEYQSRIDEWAAFTKYKAGDNNSEDEDNAKLRDEVYQQMVLEMLLDKQAEKLGFGVTPQEMKEMVFGIFPYQPLTNVQEYPWFASRETGQFDKTALENFVSEANGPTPADEESQMEQLAKRQVWKVVENRIKYQKLAEKYAFLVANAMLVSDTEAKASFDEQQISANIAYTFQPYSAIADSTIKMDDKELQAFYEKRKRNFKSNSEMAKISYFIKDVVPSEEDYATVETDMKAAHEKMVATDDVATIVAQYSSEPYADFFLPITNLPEDAKNFVQTHTIGDVYGPVRDNQSFVMYKYVAQTMAVDSIEVQMIPVPEPFDNEATNTVADSLINVLKAGKDFAALAAEINPSPQAGVKQKVSELDLIRFGLEGNKCTSAASGEVLKLAYAGGQYTMLMKVVSKNAPVAKVKLAVVQMKVAISDKTQTIIDDELGLFLSENGNLEKFDKAAESKGYGLVANTTIAASQPTLGNAAGTRSVIHWAFNEEKGAVKKFDLADKRIIAIVKNVMDAEYAPLSEVADLLKHELIRDKKAEKMIADLKAKNLTSLDAYAQAMESKVDTATFVNFQTSNITGVGFEPVLNAYAKGGVTNKLVGPVKGARGVYALSVIDKIENTAVYNAQQSKATLFQTNYYQFAQQALGALQEKMNVKDNRVRFF